MSTAVTGGTSRRTHPSAGLAVLMIVGGGVLTQLLTAVSGVICARMLGVDGRGQVVLVTSLAVMASQLTLGGSLPNAVTRQLADRGVTARDGLRHLAPRWFVWSFAPAAVASGYFLFVERHVDGSAKYVLAGFTIVMAVQTMVSRILVGAMLGEGADLIQIALTSVLPQALTVAVLTVAFVAGARWNAVELMGAMLACVMVVLLGRLRVLRPATRRPGDALDGAEVFALARRTHIGSVGPIDGLQIDRTIVGSAMGSAALGLYSAAFALAGLTSILGGCLAMVILPRVTIAQRDPAAERRLVRRWLLMSALLIAAVVVVLVVGARLIIEVTFGAEFIGAVACAHWLLVGAGLLDFRRVLIAVLQGRDVGGVASAIELALTPFMIVGLLLAAAHSSLVGAGMAMAGVGALSCVLLGVAVARSRAGGRYVPQHAPPARRAVERTAVAVAAEGAVADA